jgi:NADH-quinone oxidoreductase subunit M
MSGHWLTWVVLMPLVGVILLLVPRLSDRAARLIALIWTLVVFGFSVAMFAHFKVGVPGYQMVEDHSWMSSIGLRFTVGIDGLSLFMVMLTTFCLPLAVLASWKVETKVRLYMISMLIIETAVIGTFLALNLLMFFFFFELLLFPMYLVIGLWGSKNRVYAAVKFFLFTMFGSAFLLTGILVMYFQSAHYLGHGTFQITQLQNLPISTTAGRWLFLAFFVGFAVKVPLFPVHTWLPDAHTEAPTAGSVILAALLLKTGSYGLIRFNLGFFPSASEHFASVVSVIALIGIIYGAAVAIMQTDLKRLVAYSSVSHMGLIVLGTFAFTTQAMSGSILQMLNHGLSTGLLFIGVGMLYERTHTRQIDEMGGIGKKTPWLAGVFLVAVLSSIGLPGLNNFVGEFLVVFGTFSVHKLYGVIAATAVILSAIYLLWSYQRTWQEGEKERWLHLPDISLREALVVAPMIAVMLWIGVFPKPFLSRINPTSDRIVTQVQSAGSTSGSGNTQAAGGQQP